MSRTDQQFKIRIATEEKAWLEERAARNLRSVTAEVTMIIREAKSRAEFRGKASTGAGLGNQVPVDALNRTALQGGPINQR